MLIFACDLALVRIAGCRVFKKWSALDIVVSVIIGSDLSRAMMGGADLIRTLLATTFLMALHGVLDRSAAQSPELSQVIARAPRIVAENGNFRRSR